jgi:hypothetical protein
MVTVTDDHSLLDANKIIISPTNLKVGDKLLHSFPEIDSFSFTFSNGVILNEEISEFLGYIIASDRKIDSLKKHYIIIKYKETLLDDIKRLMIYQNEYIVPMFILNSNKKIRYAFFSGLIVFITNKISIYRITNNTVAMSFYTLGKSLGYNVLIENNTIIFSTSQFEDKIISIEEESNCGDYVYDLTTDNHHFQAGVGSLIVHNTDSIFTCYRFRDNVKRIKDADTLKLWKDIIKFSNKLITLFMPFEYRDMWDTIFMKYYRDELIVSLSLPKGPDYVEPPNHYKIINPAEERLEQFLLKYMEEGFLSWLWILQDIFNKEYVDVKIRDDMIESKLFKAGCMMIETMKLVPEDLTDEMKYNIHSLVKTFIENKMKQYILQPYWDYEDRIITRIHLYKNGVKIIDRRCLELTIEMGILAGEFIKNHLPFPHDCKYEKTFWPFLILTKKRYVGNKYEEDPNKYKQDYNGIVLKRRDNAPIVKEICGGVIKCLLNDKDPIKARDFTLDCMRKMFNNEYNIKYFQTSKTLKMKESYSDWTKIAHCVLAERIALRNPGNSPQSGDRIEFAAVVIPNLTKSTLQGERIETPEYIHANNLSIDYEFYMTNQIMNPVLQFLELVIPNAKSIFDEFKIRIENEKNGRTNILAFCKKV